VIRRRLFPSWPHRVRFDGDLILEIDPRDELATRYVLGEGFEPDVTAYFRDRVRTGMVVFDIGANVGHFTLLAAKRVGPTGQVYAFEASPTEYKKLTANVALNRLTNVVTNPMAVCDRTGTVSFQVCSDGLGLYNSLGTPLRQTATSLQVPCTSLDDYLQATGMVRVDVLKIDVEGAERLVLAGGHRLLLRSDAPEVVCEFCDGTLRGMGSSSRELRRAFEELGYRVFRYDPGLRALVSEPLRDHYDYDNLVCSKARNRSDEDGQLD
jgi:FkbM family methyltransferase